MSRPRTTMRKIREVLRLRLAEGLSPRQISSALGLPRITVRRHLERAAEKGVTWPLPGEMDDRALEDMLFARVDPTISETRPAPEVLLSPAAGRLPTHVREPGEGGVRLCRTEP